jgi:hypothetical protein
MGLCMRSRVRCVAAVALIAPALVSTSFAETTRYVLSMSDGHRAGEQVVEHLDGLTKVHYVFKDNGRGPEIDERIRTDPDGRLASYDVVGTSTLGGPIDEHFVRTGDGATWTSTSEHGQTQSAGSALYVPLNSSFEWNSISLARVAAREDGKLPLLPSGTLTQRVVDEVDVFRDGERRHVQLVSQVGIGLTPSLYWIVTATTTRLFAVVQAGYMSGIEEGWEANLDLLKKRQSKAEAKLLRDLADRTRHPLTGLTVVRNARVFDSETMRVGAPVDIYVLRGRITAIRPAGSPSSGVDNEIDAGNRIALPGLFDMHGHIGRWEGGLHLAAGVTTVRDMGNDNDQMQLMLDETTRGEVLLPHIVPCGFLEGESASNSRTGFVIRTLPQARAAVDWYAVHGYPQLKIYNSFPHEMVREIVTYAHARGMRVSGHVPVFMRAQDVVEQGFDEIQHINQVLLNFLVTPTTDTRTLARFYLPAEKLADFDLDSKRVRDFVALLRRHKTSIDPTVAAFDFIKQRDGEPAEPYEPIRAHMPPDVQRYFVVAGMKIPDDATAERYRASYQKMVDFVGRMYRAGVPIVAGTDALAGFALQAEFELYVKAGLTPAQVLQIATRNGARYSRTSADRGSLVTGKLADLILVDGDPTQRIGDIRKVALVMTQGSVISPNEVYRELAVVPFTDDGPKVRAMSTELLHQ